MTSRPLLTCLQCAAAFLGCETEPRLCPDCAPVWEKALRHSTDPVLCARYVAVTRHPTWPNHLNANGLNEDLMRFQWGLCEHYHETEGANVLPPEVVFKIICRWCRSGERGPAIYRRRPMLTGYTWQWNHVSGYGVLFCQAHPWRPRPLLPDPDPPVRQTVLLVPTAADIRAAEEEGL